MWPFVAGMAVGSIIMLVGFLAGAGIATNGRSNFTQYN